jgi:hypothetical protein
MGLDKHPAPFVNPYPLKNLPYLRRFKTIGLGLDLLFFFFAIAIINAMATNLP